MRELEARELDLEELDLEELEERLLTDLLLLLLLLLLLQLLRIFLDLLLIGAAFASCSWHEKKKERIWRKRRIWNEG